MVQMKSNRYILFRDVGTIEPENHELVVVLTNYSLEDAEGRRFNSLKSFLCTKAKSQQIHSNGSFGLLSTETEEFIICYFRLFSIPYSKPLDDKFQAKENETENPQAISEENFVLCLTAEITSGNTTNLLEVFRMEISNFCTKVFKYLDAYVLTRTSDKLIALENFLISWYSIVVLYVSRCIHLIGTNLPQFIYACLMWRDIEIFGASETVFLDLEMFSTAISIMDAHVSAPLLALDQVVSSSNTFSMNFQDGTHSLIVSSKETNKFCQFWASVFQDDIYTASQFRMFIDEMKLLVMQELNQLKKIIESAKKNSYSLYKAHISMRKTKNPDIIFALLLKDERNDSNMKDILEILCNFQRAKQK